MTSVKADLSEAISRPHLVPRELNRIYFNMVNGDFNDNGTSIFELDWDNIIILDACRVDYFSEQSRTLPGNLTDRISCASTTTEFLKANFARRDLSDSVCITGNAWYQKLREELNLNFHAFFDEDHPSPQPIVELVKEEISNYPYKRMIIHLIPPHTPYVGPTAEKYLPDYDEQHGLLADFRSHTISEKLLREAYKENLNRVIPHIRELLGTLKGKTIVTADHGELLGERLRPIPMKDYGHYAGLYVDELVNVPLLEFQNGERREIQSEPSEQHIAKDNNEIEDRLRKLGYLN